MALRLSISLRRGIYPLLHRAARTFATSAAPETEKPALQCHHIPAPGSGHVRVLLLDRPATRNAISRAVLAGLTRHVDELQEQGGTGPTRALVLGSAVDGVFCAGADLIERLSMDRKETDAFLRELRSTLSRLAALRIPTIAAVSSTALGGGLELALTTHLRVFGSASVVGLPETRLATLPGAGGTHRLSTLIGRSRALDLMLTGRRVSAPEAYFLGLCNRLVEAEPETADGKKNAEEQKPSAVGGPVGGRDAVIDVAVRLAMDICDGGPVALSGVLDAVAGDGQAAEDAAYERVLETEDRVEALRAFVEKRKPAYKGR